jgi:hypothetical protein
VNAEDRGVGFTVNGLRLNGEIDHIWFASDEPKLDGKWYRKADVTAVVIPAGQVSHGAKIRVSINQPDPCPLSLPEQWPEWVKRSGDRWITTFGDWSLEVWEWDDMWQFVVSEGGIERFEWERRTRKGAMRAAEKAARKAWAIRHGRKA